MNKSLLTNLVALIVLMAGILLPHPELRTVGLFAVSGALTNWLAIHMLFERVPGLYGSGVIPLHFDEFRSGIRALMMEQFFTPENIERFLAGGGENSTVDLGPVIDKMDLSPTFDGLVQTISESSFGGMLAMIGGASGLEPLREPYTRRMKSTLQGIAASDAVQHAIRSGITGDDGDGIGSRIATVIERRLDELTPEMVKRIIQDMIRTHLGWLVVWGGVFGGIIGLLTTLID